MEAPTHGLLPKYKEYRTQAKLSKIYSLSNTLQLCFFTRTNKKAVGSLLKGTIMPSLMSEAYAPIKSKLQNPPPPLPRQFSGICLFSVPGEWGNFRGKAFTRVGNLTIACKGRAVS